MKYKHIPPSVDHVEAQMNFYKAAAQSRARSACEECEVIYDESGFAIGEASRKLNEVRNDKTTD